MFYRNVSHRLFLQAALSAIFPLAFRATTPNAWVVVGVALALGCVGLALFAQQGNPNIRPAVIGFEAVAVAAGVIGLLGGHYVPGSIVGAYTLMAVFNGGSVVAAAPASDATPAPPAGAVATPDAPVAQPASAVAPAAAPMPMSMQAPSSAAPTARNILPGQ